MSFLSRRRRPSLRLQRIHATRSPLSSQPLGAEGGLIGLTWFDVECRLDRP